MLLALDSNVFIAALTGNEPHSQAAQQLIRNIAADRHRAVASSMVFGEILGISTGKNGPDLDSFFSSIKHLSTVPADDGICLGAAQLRKRHGAKLRLPDALHLVTAMFAGADVFITNDKVLAKTARALLPTKTLADWR
jgi:predicted nucleic acid-binding protein